MDVRYRRKDVEELVYISFFPCHKDKTDVLDLCLRLKASLSIHIWF